MFISKIKKRDGRIVDFDKDRITSAVIKDFESIKNKLNVFVKDIIIR